MSAKAPKHAVIGEDWKVIVLWRFGADLTLGGALRWEEVGHWGCGLGFNPLAAYFFLSLLPPD